MIRKFTDKHVEIIKQMLADNFRTASIIDYMKITYKINVSCTHINSIKNGESYYDIKRDLNIKIAANKKHTHTIDNELIRDIKWALVNGYELTEIIEAYNVSSKILGQIRLCHAPYFSIASEYNEQIEMLWHRRKRSNIDEAKIIAIKREFIKSKGTLTGKVLAEKHNRHYFD